MSDRPRILITGATGRIGAHLLRVLAEAEVPTRALSRDPARAEALPGIEWVSGDLAERSSRRGGWEVLRSRPDQRRRGSAPA